MSKKLNIHQLVQEEIAKLVSEAKKKTPTIENDLEKLRKKFFPEMLAKEDLDLDTAPPMHKRVQINTVAELLDVQVNELMLYFLNDVKNKNTRSLVEYHIGQVYFYAN
jgi:ABC-type transporter MlaC component